MTTQNIRFIGGSKNNVFQKVPPSTDIIGTDMTVSLKDRPSDKDFKAGDRLLCVKDLRPYLTKDRVYEALRIERTAVVVKGDHGYECVFGFTEGYLRLAEAAPKGERYTRRRVMLIDALSRYEETCFVLDTMADGDAEVYLANALRDGKLKPLVPQASPTRPIPTKDSSLIYGIRYDVNTLTLDVIFKKKKVLGTDSERGDTYRYTGVPLQTIGALLTAESLGSAYTEKIRSKYPALFIG